MNSSTIEVFNIPTVYIMHSEFHHSSPNVIGKPKKYTSKQKKLIFSRFSVTNAYVKNVTISDCLLEENAINILTNESTKVTKICTISPRSVKPQLSPECQHSMIGRWIALNGDSSVDTSGAITLALVSSFILMIAVLALYTLHRQGKLEDYL